MWLSSGGRISNLWNALNLTRLHIIFMSGDAKKEEERIMCPVTHTSQESNSA